MRNRCQNIGIHEPAPFLSASKSKSLRAEVDAYLDKKHAEWNATVPFAKHFEGTDVHRSYYQRHLIETALRIRMLRVIESRALSEITKTSPRAAQIWANYEREEMLHDKLFMDDLERTGMKVQDTLEIEPFLSTKLLSGFFSYLLEHEGPLGVVMYSYLVEYINVKIDPAKIEGMKKALGEAAIKGQVSHSHTDQVDDHPGEVWEVVRFLIKDEQDIPDLYRYIDEHQKILAMYFQEIYQATVLNRAAA